MNPSREEALIAAALDQLAETRVASVNPGSGHRLQHFSFGGLGFREGGDALVQRGQHSAPADRETQQVGVRHLLMPHQPDAGEGDRFGDRKFILPEGMVLGGGVGGENLDRFARLDGVPGECGIRNDADETSLGEGARCPALGAMTGEPPQRQFMPLMAGSEQRDEQVGVEQIALHTPSASIRRTSSVVTLGESAGRWKTTRPSLFWAGVGAFKPLRNRSDTVLPSETPRSFAWRLASSKTSSSRVRVVLIRNRCVLVHLMSNHVGYITLPG